VRWDELVVACPAIGGLAEDRFRRDQLVMLGTIRADGSPRELSTRSPETVRSLPMPLPRRSRSAWQEGRRTLTESLDLADGVPDRVRGASARRTVHALMADPSYEVAEEGDELM
jgi:hypothetical protein